MMIYIGTKIISTLHKTGLKKKKKKKKNQGCTGFYLDLNPGSKKLQFTKHSS